MPVILMIIHSPQPWREVNKSEDRFYEGNIEAWRALEDAYKAGKLRAIGVSNFLEGDLDNIIENCEIKPMVNQILAHISNTPFELIEYCQANDIVVEAYSPIAHGEAFKNEAIKAMAAKYGVSVAALCVRYTLQLGTVSLPKTANPDHMRDNANVDFVISDEDMEALRNIEHIKDYGEHSFFPVYGGSF
ncbi:MAG: aldo/keto reductase [Coriobacteriales bacterium]|nr:aldo/keto reductase [Coriobacteriales bacterium]